MTEHTGMIFDIRPGARVLVLFKGCSMNCWWCAHPELQSPAPELVIRQTACVRCGTCVTICPMDAAREVDDPAGYAVDKDACIVCGACLGECEGGAREVVGRRMTVSAVMDAVRAAVRSAVPAAPAAAGVTFGGGEPLMQSLFLLDLLRECQSLGLHTAVDTTGCAPWETFERIRPHVDLFLYELKLMDPDRHRDFTGASNDLILSNLTRLSAAGQPVRLRVPLFPGITAGDDNLRALAAFAAGLPHLQGVELAAYRQLAPERYAPAPLDDALAQHARAIFAEYGLPLAQG